MFPGLSNKDRGRGERQIGFPSLPSFPALLRSPHSGPTPGSIFVPNRINPSQPPPPQSERWAGTQRFLCVLSDTRRRVGGKVSRFLKIKLEYGFALGNIYYYPSFSAFAPFCAYIAVVILTQYLTHAIQMLCSYGLFAHDHVKSWTPIVFHPSEDSVHSVLIGSIVNYNRFQPTNLHLYHHRSVTTVLQITHRG